MSSTRAVRRPVQLLSEDTVRRIAAGEVIVRPAGVVKELIENSLDASATEIRVEVKEGGRNLIKVTDNGTGMTRNDARLAVTRHATSKLTGIEDLNTLETFGFRGEALAAIAAVSRFTLETNTDESVPGTKLEVEGGEVKEVAEAAHPVGTCIIARTLFYNLPARRSFLKSDSYELKLITETVRQYAVYRHDVGFEMVADGRVVMRLAPTAEPEVRLADLFEKQVTQGLVKFSARNPLLTLSGWVSEPSQARKFYEIQGIYFNGRPVRSRPVTRAVYDAYGPVLGDANPNFILFLSTDPARLDVNIHPTKQEVRFADERFLFDFISEAVRKALGFSRSVHSASDEFLFQHSLVTDADGQMQNFWQIHNSYILAQVATGYVIMDQHAAHERVMFEELTRQRRQVSSQGLLFPVVLNLTAEQFEVYERTSEQLPAMGIQTKVFSGRSVVVETVPAGSYMGKQELEEFFCELASTCAGKVVTELELAKLVACKGSIKAGQRLTQPEMESLFNRLFACTAPGFCPHGRPTIIKVSLEELCRKFGRE